MFPNLSIDNLRNQSRRNAKFPRRFSASDDRRRLQNFANHLLCKFCSVMSRSSFYTFWIFLRPMVIACLKSTFCKSVMRIVASSSKKQMVWIDASSISEITKRPKAVALVQNHHSFWWLAIRQNPCKPSWPSPFTFTSFIGLNNRKAPITFWCRIAHPHPTAILAILVDATPKSLDNRTPLSKSVAFIRTVFLLVARIWYKKRLAALTTISRNSV